MVVVAAAAASRCSGISSCRTQQQQQLLLQQQGWLAGDGSDNRVARRRDSFGGVLVDGMMNGVLQKARETVTPRERLKLIMGGGWSALMTCADPTVTTTE